MNRRRIFLGDTKPTRAWDEAIRLLNKVDNTEDWFNGAARKKVGLAVNRCSTV